MPDVLPFADVPADAVLLVGGKGLSLARTAAAGLPVPPGFVVTTDAYWEAFASREPSGERDPPPLVEGRSAAKPPGGESSPTLAKENTPPGRVPRPTSPQRGEVEGPPITPAFRFSDSLRTQVELAYRTLGGGLVAVRSSATAEDGADTSFAGQQETILGVEGIEALLTAIQSCWQSLYTDRAIAYRKAQGISEDGAAMAVVVQKLVPADVAGVLFTSDPADPTSTRMSVEASWGLGEAVVSGRVTPDRFTVDRDSGTAIDRRPGAKTVRFTANGEEPVPAELHSALCLSDSQLAELAELGRKVEAVYGDPRDIEWAFAEGSLFLLQARPITTATAANRETIRKEIQAEVKRLADPTGTVWVRYNLSETLPEPTPMTWDVIRVLLAANGGFGALNADLGGDPDTSLGMLGAFDLIAGRPMANLSRMPRLQFRRPPIEYPFAAYKADPRKALDPVPELKPLRNGWLRLPGTLWRLWRIDSWTRPLMAAYDDAFRNVSGPAFYMLARIELGKNFSAASPQQLVTQLREWVRKTNIDFARNSMKPTVLSTMAMQSLRDILKAKLKDRTDSVIREAVSGAEVADKLTLKNALAEVARGAMTREQFVSEFGHRCGGEMELSRPRWSEDPAAVDMLLASVISTAMVAEDAWPRVAKENRIVGPMRKQADHWVERLRTYLSLRETAKHYWLMGHAVIRRYLVELDARFKLNGGIFFLTLAELDELIAGKDMATVIATRKKRRQLELTLELPPVLFSDDLDAIGRPLPVPDGAMTLEGIALSAGVAEGPALVLTEPGPPPAEPFILVCPSTDPAWVPLFARAKGLVMETGGVLSHGAIVAREFGLPAVAGLPGIVARTRSGQRLRVDGTQGVVSVID